MGSTKSRMAKESFCCLGNLALLTVNLLKYYANFLFVKVESNMKMK